VAAGFGLYICIGVIWSMCKWYRHVKKTAFYYKQQFGDKALDALKIDGSINTREHKDEICAWIAFWPWSFLWSATGDFLTGVYNSLKNVYEKIKDKDLERAGLKVE